MADLDLTFEDLFPSRFLKASDFKGQAFALTITDVTPEEMPKHVKKKNPDDKMRVVSFKETKKQLALNKTNAVLIVAIIRSIAAKNIDDGVELDLFCKRTKNWVGHRFFFGPAMVKFGAESLPAIRVKGSPELSAPLKGVKQPKGEPVTLVSTVHKRDASATPAIEMHADAGPAETGTGKCPSCNGDEGGCDICNGGKGAATT